MAQKVIEVQARYELKNLFIQNASVQNPIYLGPLKLYDYNKLHNKPTINGCVLQGDLNSEDIGFYYASAKEVRDYLRS